MKRVIVVPEKAVRIQLGYRPKYYRGSCTIGKHFRVLKRRFRTATEAEQYAQRFAAWCNKAEEES